MAATAILGWVENLQTTSRGKIFLNNLAHDFTAERLSRKKVVEIIKGAIERWESDHRAKQAEMYLSEVVDSFPSLYLCSGPSCKNFGRGVSRIMDAGSFLSRNIDLAAGGITLTDHSQEAVIRYIEIFGLARVSTGEMRTSRPFAWVAKSSDIEHYRQPKGVPLDRNEVASQLRTLLGLHHYTEDQILIEVVYPSAPVFLDALNLAAPTFAEGSRGLVFRSKSSADDWGFTVNLSSLGDGIEEAVHQPVNFTDHFRVQSIGRLDRVDYMLDLAAVADSCPVKWSDDVLRDIVSLM